MEISKRECIEEKVNPIKLEFPEYNLPTKRASGMSLKEICAEKIRAIMTRKKARDLYDLQYLIEKKHILFNESLASKKLAYCNKKFTKKEFLEKAGQKKAYYEKELKNLVFDELPEFKKTLNTIKKWIKTK